MDSDCESDRLVLEQIDHWIDQLDRCAIEIDWERAKEQYEGGPNPGFSTEDFDAYRRDQARNYWVLKTTSGTKGPSHWEKFIRERVVSIGWEDIVEVMASDYAMGPKEYDIETLSVAASAAGHPEHAVRMLHCFAREFSIGDRIILCRGYSANQSADVRLYGLAIVDDEVVDDQTGDWWRLKRRAVFRRKDRKIPKDVFVNSLGKRSLLFTIHRISEGEYKEFCRQTRRI